VAILFNAFLRIFNDPNTLLSSPFKMKKRFGRSGKEGFFPKKPLFNMI
jgi:hypothetical protein